MKARVTVRLKKGVLDPQGRAIADALHGLGFGEALDARVGKVIEIDLDETDAVRGEARAKDMATKLLANPVIESWDVEIVTA
jgi:phosphoribosylformylglycinamidine synthase subunit PurS